VVRAGARVVVGLGLVPVLGAAVVGLGSSVGPEAAGCVVGTVVVLLAVGDGSPEHAGTTAASATAHSNFFTTAAFCV
jgi:hypothetical protein